MAVKDRNIFITPRDIDIFRILSSGPCMALRIKDELKNFHHFKLGKKKKKQKSELEQEELKEDKQEEEQGHEKEDSYCDREYFALIVRLKKLREGGYIKSKRYAGTETKGVFSLYALTPHSIEVLLREGVKENYIRSTLPKSDGVRHELQVSEVVRIIKKEASKLFYELEMEDENLLKRRAGGSKRNHAYPDVYVKLKFRISDSRVFAVDLAVEVDNEGMREKVVVEKFGKLCKQRKWSVMVVCRSTKRMERLRFAVLKYIEREKANLKEQEKIEKLENMKNRVFFCLNNDFSAKGFLDTVWNSPEGHNATTIPKDIRSK